MDHLASKKETARAQLASTEAQLWSMREKVEAQSRKIEELQSQLSSVIANRETLVKDLKEAKWVAEITKDDADEMVDRYKADADTAQGHLKNIVEYVKWHSWREALQEVHARGFDLSVEIKSTKGLEAKDKKLSYPKDKEDSEGLEEPGTKKTSMVLVMRWAPVRTKLLICFVDNFALLYFLSRPFGLCKNIHK